MVRQHAAATRDAYTAGRDLYVNVDQRDETVSMGPLGRVIGELGEQDALALEVHQAFPTGTANTAGASERVPVLPVYLPRTGFEDRLQAVGVVVGSSRGG